MQNLLDPYSDTLKERQETGRLRQLRATRVLPGATLLLEGKQLVNFSSNDYLGLSQHPALKTRALEYIEKFGVGSTASRLICGNQELYEPIEQKLALLKGTETALIMASGFQTNSTVLAALAGNGGLIGSDKLNHASITSGLILSRSHWFRYRHNDPQDLESRLSKKQGNPNSWIVTESVFSMDGDIARLSEIKEIATKYGARLYVDEAHATGVLGASGMGLSAKQNLADICMGTFGKGLGSFGSYIACSNQIRDFLVNCCSGLIYSTALPPAVLGAIDAALDLIPEMNADREKLLSNANYLRSGLKNLGFDCGESETQIVPIIVGSEKVALALSLHLEQNGLFVPAIRPPTVPDGTARLRISLSSQHTQEHINTLLTAFRNWHEKED